MPPEPSRRAAQGRPLARLDDLAVLMEPTLCVDLRAEPGRRGAHRMSGPTYPPLCDPRQVCESTRRTAMRPRDHPFLGPPRALVAQQEGVCCEPHSRVTWTTAKCLVKRAKRAWRALPHPGSETESSPNLPVLPCVRTSVSKALCREARRWLRSVVCAPSGHRSVQHTCNISGRLGPDLYALVHVSGRRSAPFVLVNAHFATLCARGEGGPGFESLLRYELNRF